MAEPQEKRRCAAAAWVSEDEFVMLTKAAGQESISSWARKHLLKAADLFMEKSKMAEVIKGSCPHCNRVVEGDEGQQWYRPCPDPDCFSNNKNRRKMGYCPNCGGNDLEMDDTDIEAWSDDTPFPTISVRFKCNDCDHVVEVSYDRDDKLHEQPNTLQQYGVYDGDPDGNLDNDDTQE